MGFGNSPHAAPAEVAVASDGGVEAVGCRTHPAGPFGYEGLRFRFRVSRCRA